MSSNGRVAVITGAGTGIGKASALALLSGGYSVALAGRRVAPLEETVTEAGEDGARAIVVSTDVGDPESVKALFDKTRDAFGRLDVLFNNAGTGAPPVLLEDLTYEQWMTVVNANLTGTFLCTQLAFHKMKSQDPMGRAHHQQRLPFGARSATKLDTLHIHQACGDRNDARHRARRTQVQHSVQPNRHRQCRDADDSADAPGRPTGAWRDPGRADDERSARGGRNRVHRQPAAGCQRPVHERHGDQDAVHRPRLESLRECSTTVFGR